MTDTRIFDTRLSDKLARHKLEELDDKSKLEDLETRTKIKELKRSDKSGIVDTKSTFDLKKFNEGVDNQGRRDMLIDALKSRDEQNETVMESKVLLQSKVKKLKETLELQKRYYQLVPRTPVEKNMPIIATNDPRQNILQSEKYLYEFRERGKERISDISQLTPFSPPAQLNIKKVNQRVNDLSIEPYVFVRVKPTEANLNFENLSREKFHANLNKLKISTDTQRESEAIREYSKLSTTAIINPEAESGRRKKLKDDIRNSFGTEYKSIINDYYKNIDAILSRLNVIIGLKSSDIDISNITLADFEDIKWKDNTMTTAEYYMDLLNNMNQRGPNFKCVAPPAGGPVPVFNVRDYVNEISGTREKDGIFSRNRYYNEVDRLKNIYKVILAIANDCLIDPVAITAIETVCKSQNINEENRPEYIQRSKQPFQLPIWKTIYNNVKSADEKTKDVIDQIINEKKKLKKKLDDLTKVIQKENDARTTDLLKPTNIDKEKVGQFICKLLMGDLYVTTLYGNECFSGYELYSEKNTPNKRYTFDFDPGGAKFIVGPVPPAGHTQDPLDILGEFVTMLKNRLELYPNKYKLFPQDIKFICLILSIPWSPFINIKKFIPNILSSSSLSQRAKIKAPMGTREFIIDYYNKIDPVCYEYLEKVLPIFSVNSTYPRLEDGKPWGGFVDLKSDGKIGTYIDNNRPAFWSKVKISTISNEDKCDNTPLPLAEYDALTGGDCELKRSFYEAIKNINIPELKLTLTSFGIENLININSRYQNTYWTSLKNINQINVHRENSAFYYIEEKLQTVQLSNDYFDKFGRLQEMETVVSEMNKVIDERDFTKSQKDNFTQQLELGLESFAFWKSSDESKTEVFNILREFKLSKYFAPLDKKKFASVGKFLQLEDSELFKAVTKDFEMSEQDNILMKKAISTLKERIETTKEDIEEKDKDSPLFDEKPKTTQEIISKDQEIISDEKEIISAQKQELEKDIQELKDDEEQIKLLTKEHEDILQRNSDLDKLLKQAHISLNKQQSHTIDIDELMVQQINDTLQKYKKQYERNSKSSQELLEIISTMKNIYTSKKNRLLLSQNRQLKKSLDDARHIIHEHESQQLHGKITEKQKDLKRLHKKRTKKKYKKHADSDAIPVYRVLTPRK